MILNYINKIKLSKNIFFLTFFFICIFFNFKLIITSYKILFKKRQKSTKNIKFIICGAPIHNNYGDDAILMSTKNFLKFYFPKNKQIILNSNEILKNKRIINYINKEDILIINGGGYFGLYEYYVNEYEFIINSFPNNQIIFFPCSIQYSKEKLIYKKYINAYNKHKNITIFTRENKSYEIAEKIFKNISIYIVPDIVTRFNMSIIEKNENKKGVLLILRKDELLLTDKDRLYINKLAKKHFKINIFMEDLNDYVIPFGSNHEKETIKFINNISKKKLVITDRLHGMIFSIITGTPCIVFGNNYHKIESSYFTWFNNLEYAIFIKKEDIENKLEENIIKFKNLKNYTIYNYKMFNQYYLLIKDILQEKINININV